MLFRFHFIVMVQFSPKFYSNRVPFYPELMRTKHVINIFNNPSYAESRQTIVSYVLCLSYSWRQFWHMLPSFFTFCCIVVGFVINEKGRQIFEPRVRGFLRNVLICGIYPSIQLKATICRCSSVSVNMLILIKTAWIIHSFHNQLG